MKKHMKFVALSMALILCLGLLSACSSGDDGAAATDEVTETEEPVETSEVTETEEPVETDAAEETDPGDGATDEDTLQIAEVTAIAEDGTLSMTLYTLIEGAEEPSDYADIDMSVFEAGTETAEYLPDETVQIYVASDGTLTEATAADIAVGDMLAFYKTEDGTDAIAIYHPVTAE